jgi:hypothetical protein
MANNQNLNSFTKGDKRINRRGRPRNIDLVRLMAQPIGNELVPYGPDGRMITTVEALLRDWAESDEFKKQLAFVQYAFGKVPDKEVTEDRDVKITVNWDPIVTPKSLAQKKVIDHNPDEIDLLPSESSDKN